MAFFEAPKPSRLDPVEVPEPKPWWARPPRTLPGRLAETVMLAHTNRVAVLVTELAAYPTGLTFELQTVPRRPPGSLTFACEWPALGIPLTRVEIDAALVRRAADRAQLLWPDDGG